MRSAAFLLAASVSALAGLSASPPPTAGTAPSVAILSTPDGGIQPQAAVDEQGIIHLVYFKGDPAAGDLFYATVTARNGVLTAVAPTARVNSVAGSALATGTVRGAQIALGRNGAVHVAWHGSRPAGATGSSNVTVWYARSSDGRTFEPQRAVSDNTTGIDGSTVAADTAGHVTVAWHAMGPRRRTGERDKTGDAGRTVYLAASTNDGASFARATPATSAPIGACGCCGLKAMFDRAGTLNLLYRAATDGRHRDTTWLTVASGVSRRPVRVDKWDLDACPMTTYALADAGQDVAAAWETAQQIYSATLNPATGAVSGLAAAPGTGSRKHPSIAVNGAGARLLAWTEGTAWKRGGTFAWRVTDRTGVERASAANAGVVPVWGLVSAVALPDGSFVIFR
jgi:hypothetical protein